MEKANLHEGDSVTFSVDAPGIVTVRAVRTIPTLAELLSSVTDENQHGETEWGEPRGKEVW